MKFPLAISVGVAVLTLSACTMQSASSETDGMPTGSGLRPAALQSALNAVRDAGMIGVYMEVRDGDQTWNGTAGVADIATGAPIGPDMVHRVGSITKTFVAAAIMQQVEQGRIGLDTSIGDYLPQLVPGERGAKITVRMLLDNTSGLAEHLPYSFPSLAAFFGGTQLSSESLDEHRFTQFDPVELIGMGVSAPPATSAPGATPGVYSNTNYFLLAQLLEKVTGTAFQTYIAENVIARAGLEHTAFPDGPTLTAAHPRMYEALFGMIDPPRDYSVYDMSWALPGAGLVSTMSDLNRFYRMLLSGQIVSQDSLTQMQRTVPVIALDGSHLEYGFGLHKVRTPAGEIFWGHDGSVFGTQSLSLTSADGTRQMSVTMNLVRWNELGPDGKPKPHPIDDALTALYQVAMGGK
ncbi:serine hydrolase domain-containing protein [Nocardia sp. NPDC058666]|uniref:serine hydrolase domain-containing protein n=1 Tax=Nocardia sp. NPDC058666 TaxID=3346587 RepID=UPI003650AAFB